MPVIAEEFFRLSRSLYPNMSVPGRWPLRALSLMVGARRAMIVSAAMRRARSQIRRLEGWVPRRRDALAA
jgi:hypothetical protein